MVIMTEKPPLHTLESATQSLEHVRLHISKIYQMHAQLQQLLRQMRINQSHELSLESFDKEHTLNAASSVKVLLSGIQDFINELENKGCTIRSMATGVIEWQAKYQSRDIFLRWEIGEEGIRTWYDPTDKVVHPIDALETGQLQMDESV